MSFKEIMELKDELLKSNRELEIRLKTEIETYTNEFTQNILLFNDKIKTMHENNTKVMSSLPNINLKISKIDGLEKFGVRADNKLSSHDSRITSILKEIEKIKTKYDKIFLDNLLIPGHIGVSCRFPNVAEYLLSNINEVSLIKLETEKLKRDTKNLKNKQDYNIKQIVNLVDGSVRRCNEYTDNKQKDFQLLLDTKMKEFNEKIMEIRMNVLKNQMKSEDSISKINAEFDNIIKEKIEFTNMFQNKLAAIEEEFSLYQKNYKSSMDNIKIKNNIFESEIKKIKDNIDNILKLIKYIQKKQKNHNADSFNSSIDSNKKSRKRLSEFDSSIYKNIKDNKFNNNLNEKSKFTSSSENIFDLKGNSNNLKNSYFRRSYKKRNTMFYTGPSLSLKNKAQMNFKELNMNQLAFGRKNQLLKSMNNTINKNQENNKNNSSKDKFSIIYSDMDNSNENDNENNSKSIKNNKSNSSLDLESNIKENNDNKDTFQFSIQRKRSKSIEYYSNLTIEPNGKNGKGIKNKVTHSKILEKSKAKKQSKNNNKHKENEAGFSNNKKKRESVGSVNSVKSRNNKKDIIENKKISLNSNNINSIKGITENNMKFTNKKNISINNSAQKNKNDLKEDTKNNNKIQKNENLIKNQSQNNINNDALKNNFSNRISRNNNSNSNQILKPLNLISKSQNDFNSLSLNQINNIINRNNNNIDIYNFSSLSKNHKISNVLFAPKEQYNKIRLYKNAQFQKNIDIDIDSDTGIEYKIVSFDMPKNDSLPQKINQFYSLYGKKLQKKQQIKKTEEKSPLEEIYKNQYEKKLKKEKLKSLSSSNDAPKKITPVFGRTAYAFYSKKDLEGFRANYTSSNYLKGSINLNTISSMNNLEYMNTKYFAKSHRKYYLDKNNI